MGQPSIEPALSAEEWAKYQGPHLLPSVKRSTFPIEGILPDIVKHSDGRITVAVGEPELLGRPHALIAVLNELLPDPDPRKITRDWIDDFRWVVEELAGLASSQPSSDRTARRNALVARLEAHADALASYLPPRA